MTIEVRGERHDHRHPGWTVPVRLSRYALVLGGGIVLAVALFVAAEILAEAGATDHGRLHAAIALIVLLIGGAILRFRPRASVASRAAVVGLLLVAAAQSLESLGALGYGPDNETRRSGLVAFHDLGLAATGLALFGLVVAAGVAVGAAIAARSSRGILVPGLVASAIIAAGAFVLARMIGL